MAPHHVRETVKKLKDVGARIYQGRDVHQADGALVQDCADLILEFLAADDDRAKREAFVKSGRRQFSGLFEPDDILVLEGAATLMNPVDLGDAAIGDAIAEIVGEWLADRSVGYFPQTAEPAKEA